MTTRRAAHATAPAAGPRRRRAAIAWLLAAVVAGGLAFVVAVEAIGVPPRLLGPYLERRASGHNPAIERIGAVLNALLQRIDRGEQLPRLHYPAWALPPPAATAAATPPAAREITVAGVEPLRAALADARPGDVITIAPGSYLVEDAALDVGRPGTAAAPVMLRAPARGSVTLHFRLLEGFLVRAPHWVFENLTIAGGCRDHGDCEHAFHVVGGAVGTVIRANDLRDFNAHIKINGHRGEFPDGGRIEGNRLTNTAARRTDAPVTPIDLVAANGWHVEGNFIADFVKDGGDRTSYGAFAKGAGRGNRFVRNVVLCEHRLRGAAGRRIGLSFGGGGSAPVACRDRRCVVEHEAGLMRDNLVASCSDAGIYVNRAAQSELQHNTLIDTAGIQIRFAQSSADLHGNLMDGPLRVHDGASVRAHDNVLAALPLQYLGIHRVRGGFTNAAELDLRWTQEPPRGAAASGEPRVDLCGQPRPAAPAYGAFEDFSACLRR